MLLMVMVKFFQTKLVSVENDGEDTRIMKEIILL